jgi:tetratricopeptide (TPR) repeat protein
MRVFAICACLILLAACADSGGKERHFEAGRQHLLAGRASDAIVELRNAVALDGKWGEARALLARAYEADGQVDLAYRQFIRAADLLPDDAQAQVKAATLLLRSRRFAEARDRAERMLQTSPNNLEAQVILANAMAGLRDPDAAQARLAAVIAKEPRSDAYASLAALQLSLGRVEEALAAYQKAIEIDPHAIDAHIALANLQWQRGDASAAEQTFQRGVTNNPADLPIRRALARFYQTAGRTDEAEQHLKVLAGTTKTVDDQLELADYYEITGRFAEARRILDALAANPDSRAADIETRLARLDDAQGAGGAAVERLSAVLAKTPDATEALMLRAEWSLRDRRWEDARTAANAAIATSPRQVAPYLLRAEADLRTHRDADAIVAYRHVLSLDPGDVDAAIALSRLNLSRQLVDSAVQYAEEAVKNSPGHLDGRLALVRAWIVRGDDARARAELDGLAAGQASAELFTLDGMLRLKQGDTSGARAAFTRALGVDAASLEALNTLVALDVRSRQFAAARRWADAALAARRDDPRLLLLSAKLALVSGDRRLAESQLRRAIEIDPLDITGFTLLARLYVVEKRVAEAVEEFDALARETPASLAPRLMSAVALHTFGDTLGAARRYREVLKMEPRSALAGRNLAAIYARRGEALDSAEQLASMAADQLPADGEVRDTLGTIYQRLSKYGLAFRAFEQAVAIEPSNANYRYHLGNAYAEGGERDRAADAYRAALRVNPGFTAARTALDSLSRLPLPPSQP